MTGAQVRPDAWRILERETGWAVIDPAEVAAVVRDSEPKTSACQALERELPVFAVQERDRADLAPSARRREDGGGLIWRLVMALRIICMCGYVIQGDDDDELWQNAQDHMGLLHPELVGNVSREDLLAQAEQL